MPQNERVRGRNRRESALSISGPRSRWHEDIPGGRPADGEPTTVRSHQTRNLTALPRSRLLLYFGRRQRACGGRRAAVVQPASLSPGTLEGLSRPPAANAIALYRFPHRRLTSSAARGSGQTPLIRWGPLWDSVAPFGQAAASSLGEEGAHLGRRPPLIHALVLLWIGRPVVWFSFPIRGNRRRHWTASNMGCPCSSSWIAGSSVRAPVAAGAAVWTPR